jgi:hypothetical protein
LIVTPPAAFLLCGLSTGAGTAIRGAGALLLALRLCCASDR